jgi:hypothetical protein
MYKLLLAGALVATVGTIAAITPADARKNNRFHVVDGDTGQVLYNDGRNDGGCVFRRRFVGYDYWGNPRFRKVYHCY